MAWRLAGLGGALLAGSLAAPAFAAPQCVSAPGPDAPMQIDADCIDPSYNDSNFVIDSVTQETLPSAHTRVKAHFKPVGAMPQFNVTFYLPPRAQWQGRFFQHAYPLHQEENHGDIAFALSSGAYLVNVEGVPCGCGGYRPDAAAAKLARAYATKLYGARKHIYGYLWGGSGGSFQTIGAVENTTGIWDGAVPLVIANEGALVNYNAIMALAGFALKDRMAAIADAVKPGGTGDPAAGLDTDQRAIFTEALKMGVPLRGFEATPMFSSAMLGFLSPLVFAGDATYVDDFWTKPGYEGANPPAFLKAGIVDQDVTVTRIVRDASGKPVGVQVDPAVAADAIGVEGALAGPDGKALPGVISFVSGGSSVLGQSQTNDAAGQGAVPMLSFSPMNDPSVLAALTEGAKLRLSNRRMLALLFYHRHGIPQARDLYVYDQFRHPDGTPIYPQRSYFAPYHGMLNTSGGDTQTGRIKARIIIMDSLIDVSAFPYGADYYAGKVRRAIGDTAFADNVRVYYQDNADHFDDAVIRPINAARLVSYVPVEYQAVRDLAAWVEQGKPPPASTRYRIVDSQVVVPKSAAERGGIQPVVDLTVNGGHRIEVAANQPVTLRGAITVPPGTGKAVSTEWYLGEGPIAFTPPEPLATPTPSATVTRTVSYAKPGTYFVTLRATTQRDGKIGDPTAMQNIDRVRIIVR